MLFITFSFNSVEAQNILVNPSFELPRGDQKIKDWNLIEGWSSLDKNSGIENIEFYSPVQGDYYALQKGAGGYIYQEIFATIDAGKRYELKLWARSINPPGISAKTIIEVKLYFDCTTIISNVANVNAPQLKGAAAVYPNDDGANIWVDGNYRHEFADYHLYQPISYDPIKDPWLLVNSSSYRKLKGFGWAVGTVTVGGQKFIYGTLYRDKPENFYSSITLTKVLTTNGYNYTWSRPVTVLSHSKTEIPWVYANGGRIYMPIGANVSDSKKGVSIFTKDGSTTVVSLNIHQLKSIWK
jgi:hypothetical protein